MPRFDLVNPAAAAGEAISRYFDELRARQQEDRAEQLGFNREKRLAEQHAATIELQKKQLESIDAQRQATIDAQQAARELKEQEMFAGQYRPGDDVSADPRAAKFPGLVAQVAPTQGAHLGDDEQGIPTYDVNPGKTTFRGTPEQRAVEEQKAAVRGILTSTPELQDHPGVKAALQLAEATGDYSGIYGALAQMTKEPTPGSKGTLQQQANDAHAAGNMAEYNRLLSVIKATGQADDRPLTPYIWMNPGAAPAIIDRTTGRVRDVTTADGGAARVQNTAEQANRQGALGRVNPVLDSIAELSARINTRFGPEARVSGWADVLQAKANLDDDVAEYNAVVQMFTPMLARAVGHVGVLTEQDVQSVRAGLPHPGDSKTVRDRKMARIATIMSGQAAESPGGVAPPSGAAAPTEPPAGARRRVWNRQTNRFE